MSPLLMYLPTVDNQQRLPGVWYWSVSCSLRRDFQISKPLTLMITFTSTCAGEGGEPGKWRRRRRGPAVRRSGCR
jgi:hypothetical protein